MQVFHGFMITSTTRMSLYITFFTLSHSKTESTVDLNKTRHTAKWGRHSNAYQDVLVDSHFIFVGMSKKMTETHLKIIFNGDTLEKC